jgi:hypothetical protein
MRNLWVTLLLTSADAYRFARGEKVVASNGLPAKLKRPLDFLAVTDHAEFMGIYRMFNLQDPRLMSTRLGREWREKYGTSISKETMEQGPIDDTANNPILEFVVSINDPDPERDGYPQDIRAAIWTDVARTADEFNSPWRIYGIFSLRMDRHVCG